MFVGLTNQDWKKDRSACCHSTPDSGADEPGRTRPADIEMGKRIEMGDHPITYRKLTAFLWL